MYHPVSWRSYNSDWKFLEDDEIRKNDAVIISYPFSDLGDKHPLTEEVLNRCEELNVPVLIDCTYFGTCHDIDFNLSYNCITDVTFSLSKSFDVANARIGIRLSKIDDDDPLFVVNKINYTNRLGAYIGLQLINQFSPDFISLKYKFISKSKQDNCIGISLDVKKDISLELVANDFVSLVGQFRRIYDCGGYLSCAPMAWMIYKNRISSKSIIEYLKIYKACENYRRNSSTIKLWKIGEQFKLNPRAMVKSSDSPAEIVEKHIVMGQTVSAACRKGKLLALNASNGIFPKI